MSTILFSCYRCDPDGVSEARSGFLWALMVGQRHRVILATPSFNAEAIRAAVAAADPSPDITVLEVDMPDLDSALGRFGSAVKPGFFLYDRRLLALLRARGVDDLDYVWHRNPMSLRHPTVLGRLGVPFIVGPMGGGLKDPPILKDYFRSSGPMSALKLLDGPFFASSAWRRYLENASLILVASDYVRGLLPESVRARARAIAELGLDEASFFEPSDHEGFMVLFVGRLVRYKAPVLAAEAFYDFYERAGRPAGVRMEFVGDGPERGEIERLIESKDLSAVSVAGWLPRSQLIQRYRNADVFLFPSITEAFGHVYVEAMAAGLPSVVVDYGGGADVPDSGCAIQVPLQSLDAMQADLSDALMRLYEDPDLRQELGSAARRRASEQFTWTAMADRVDRMLAEDVSS